MTRPPTDPFAVAPRIDAELAGFVAARGLPANLSEAVMYSLLGPGKRLRPILVWSSCQAVGGDPAVHWGPAAALELVHCFSLVHDDLPAMDDDDLRRGRPTLHKHASEAMAILAGDEMLALAFDAVLATESGHPRLADLIAELSRATSAMIVGQVHDTLGGLPEAMPDAERVRHVHAHKTGALIRAACRMGGIAGGADTSQLAAVGAYGDAVGLMFQIVDDILDVTQTTEHLGKRSHKDAQAGKLTYPGVHGVEASRAMVRSLHDRAVAALEPLGPAADGLRDICVRMADRTK